MEHSTSEFKYALGDSVCLKLSEEEGVVRGRAEYAHTENNYYIMYEAADGRQVEDWWGESQLDDVESNTVRDGEHLVAMIMGGDTLGEMPTLTPTPAPTPAKYDLKKMEFDIDDAKTGNVGGAFRWLFTPQGVDFWSDQSDNMTVQGQLYLNEMIAQYEAEQTSAPWDEPDNQNEVQSIPIVVYDFDKIGMFHLEDAKAGEIMSAFDWSKTPQPFSYWCALSDYMTPEGQAVLDDMIKQYEAKQETDDVIPAQPFKLEAGKKYKSRDGTVYGPLVASEDQSPFIFRDPLAMQIWREDGTWALTSKVDGHDLMEEVEAPVIFKLEVGKYYRSRNGDVYGPMLNDGSGDEFHFSVEFTGHWWKADGSFSVFGSSHDMDLIEEASMFSKSAA